MMKKIYPRTGDTQTVYLNAVVKDPSIEVGDIVIDNDVWIGYEAVIMAGVHIGNGAIIAARAVVTKDVPSYTIVGGVPARPIRKRFDEEVIWKLETLQWWDWSVEKIQRCLPYIGKGDVNGLVQMVEPIASSCLINFK